MNICVLMPTYGRTRELIQNAIACFESQTHVDSYLFILDDEGWWHEQQGRRWSLLRAPTRAPDLGSKYNWMVRHARAHWQDWTGLPRKPDAFAVWDDDDIYLPWHLHAVAEALATRMWAHPGAVWSTYTGSPQMEEAAGRFHGALAVRDLAAEWVETRRSTFDQEMLARLQATYGTPGRPDDYASPSYVFRWADTGSHHCQAYMRGRDDETWYDRYAEVIRERRAAAGERPPEILTPQFDAAAARTRGLIDQQLGRAVWR